MNPKVIAVVGSREPSELTFEQIGHIMSVELFYLGGQQNPPRPLIISGGAKGIDTLAIKVAKELYLQTQEYPADWEGLGKKAGFVRNEDMVTAADMVIAYWNGTSKGTKHSIDLALRKGKELRVHFI